MNPWANTSVKRARRVKSCKKSILATCLHRPETSSCRREITLEVTSAERLASVDGIKPRDGFDLVRLSLNTRTNVVLRSDELLLHTAAAFVARAAHPSAPGYPAIIEPFCGGTIAYDRHLSEPCDVLFEIPSDGGIQTARLFYRGTPDPGGRYLPPVPDAVSPEFTIPARVTDPIPKVTLHPQHAETSPDGSTPLCIDFVLWAHDGATVIVASLTDDSNEAFDSTTALGGATIVGLQLAYFSTAVSPSFFYFLPQTRTASVVCDKADVVASNDTTACRACFVSPIPADCEGPFRLYLPAPTSVLSTGELFRNELVSTSIQDFRVCAQPPRSILAAPSLCVRR